MFGVRDLLAVARAPTQALRERLPDASAPHTLFVSTVTPFAAIRSLALLVRSAAGGSFLTGLVLGLGHFALQVGTWLGVSLLLPALGRQFHAMVTDRQAFALTTYASIPFWVAGVFYSIPDEPALLLWWRSILVAAACVYGFFLVHRGLVALGVRRSMRMPLLGGVVVAALTIYGLLFLLLGVGSLIVLYVAG